MNTIFPLSKTALKSLCLVVLFLLGGVSVEQNSISLGTNSCRAITVNHLPAKGKAERKLNRLYSRIHRFLTPRPNDRWSYNFLGWLVIIIPIAALLGGGIVFSVWAINLFMVSKIFGGILALLVGVGLFYLLIRWFKVLTNPRTGWNVSQ